MQAQAPVLAVLGGSFDPPHLGHAMIPAYLFARGLADEVLVVPTFRHALGKVLSPYGQRVAWARAAMATYGRRVGVSVVERELAHLHPERPSYSLDLLEHLAARHSNMSVRLVIGSDIVETGETAKWHRFGEIERKFAPIVVPRVGYGSAAGALPEVSSTEIRARLTADPQDPALEGLVPAAVLALLEHPPESDRGAVAIFGRGHVAAHLGPWLEAKGNRVVYFSARDARDWQLDQPMRAALLLTRDHDLPRLASALRGRLARSVPVFHAAGSLRAPEVLRALATAGHDVGTLHPICSLRREHPHRYLDQATFGLEASGAARAVARELLGADTPIVALDDLDANARLAYHGACALAANHLVVLRQAAVEVLDAPDGPSAIDVLLASSLENLRTLGVPAGVTGPLSRGDHETVTRHLAALRDQGHTEQAQLYAQLSRVLATLLGPRESAQN